MSGNSGGVALVLMILVGSLLASTTLISYFLLSMYGEQAAGLPIPDFPSMIKSYPSNQNFSAGQYNKTILGSAGDWSFTKQTSAWEYVEGEGLVLQQDAVYPYEFSGITLFIDNIKADINGEYTNYYWLKQSPEHSEFTILLRATGDLSNNEITVQSDGYHFYKYNPYIFRHDQIGFIPDAQVLSEDELNIRTVYNDKLNTVAFNVNGRDYYFDGLNGDSILTFITGSTGKWYGGIAAKKTGFTFESFDSTNTITISASPDSATDNFLGQVGLFLGVMAQITALNVDEKYLPLLWNIVLIKSQLFGILICCIVIIWK